MTSSEGKCVGIRLHLSGNAATQRGLINGIVLLELFRDHERSLLSSGDLNWSGTCVSGRDNDILFRNVQHRVNFLKRFISFVCERIQYDALNSRARFYSSIRVHNGITHFCMRALYRFVKSYELVVLAPVPAQPFVTTLVYFTEVLKSMSHWNVNSITNVSSVQNGFRFDAIEADATAAFNHISETIRGGLCDLLWHTGPAFVMRTLIRKCRRGDIFYLRVGIDWAELGRDSVWGEAWPSVPISTLTPLAVAPREDVCAICLDPLESEVVCWDTCRHMFHLQCVRNMWDASTQDVTCPLCRSPLHSLRNVVITPVTESKKRRPVTRSMTRSLRRKVLLD